MLVQPYFAYSRLRNALDNLVIFRHFNRHICVYEVKPLSFTIILHIVTYRGQGKVLERRLAKNIKSNIKVDEQNMCVVVTADSGCMQ